MTSEPETSESLPAAVSVAIGVGVGVAIYGFFLLAGFIVADWSLREFFAYLTPDILGWLLLVSGVVVAIFAFPIIAYLYFRVVSPLVVLVVVVVGWLSLGIGQGIPLEALFGLAYYALAFSPVYILLYLVSWGVEYKLKN